MISLILVLITLSFGRKCYYYELYQSESLVDTVDSAFECIEEPTISKDNKKLVINRLKRNLESYVYKDILKNPPTQTGTYYYNKVDIDKEIDKINMDEGSLYEFYSQIQNLFISAKDPLLSFAILQKDEISIRNYIAYFYYFLPFNIMIDKEKHMYLIPKYYYKDTKIDVPTEIENNKNNYVKSINGDDPFELIRNFGIAFSSFKSPHAQFTNSKSSTLDNSFTQGNLVLLPLSKEYLRIPLTIKWENGESVDVHYSILKLPTPTLHDMVQDKNLLKTKEIDLDTDDIKSEYGDLNNNIYCKVSINNINTLVIKRFNVFNDMQVLKKCVELFDSNEYPIQVILPENDGGSEGLGIWIQKLLAPNYDADLISSARESDNTKGIITQEGLEEYVDPKTCIKRVLGNVKTKEMASCLRTAGEYLPSAIRKLWPYLPNGIKEWYCTKKLKEWYTKPNTIKYGSVKHVITQPSRLIAEPPLHQMKLMKNPRKPTEIVVYTDSFCYSACSIMTKGLKEWGGAIIVGFSGDPNGKDEEFEVGQSPSIRMKELFEEENTDSDPLRFSFNCSFLETFRHNYNYDESIPREFLTDVVDERVNIYQFDKTEEAISEFEEETKKIIEKYQTKCNPKNKRLVKIDNKCDKEINKEHGHGGYECGDKGEWSTKCVLAYCDSGYKFDYNSNQCIEDECVFPPSLNSGMPIMTVNLVMIIIGIITLIL
ncbi:hypothetical protein EDI_102430 [Entamoeba dispar SAW760]|uniref:EGF-like domain-containing protein n=1 Tax=Entamoeba dispar (strain ATCC PRA-260 / SAW760) TaxID=370354 RepID=B0ERD7_ENTDS|nr:uncharacterized protein EDI_102430 [Entamoeba dispar SAW760]EDR22909.1 hypothetical protein EDI_102430 [Entamoeba dispar SAW760]|eukprot:EDR22909.1 hypothetical protein EDI_102430 [Entamoeba dispar SAW760]